MRPGISQKVKARAGPKAAPDLKVNGSGSQCQRRVCQSKGVREDRELASGLSTVWNGDRDGVGDWESVGKLAAFVPFNCASSCGSHFLCGQLLINCIMRPRCCPVAKAFKDLGIRFRFISLFLSCQSFAYFALQSNSFPRQCTKRVSNSGFKICTEHKSCCSRAFTLSREPLILSSPFLCCIRKRFTVSNYATYALLFWDERRKRS